MLKNDLYLRELKEKENNNSMLYSCIEGIQYILVDLCKKLTNIQFSECPMIFKNKIVAEVVNYLRKENQEELVYFNNFLKILIKIPDIFQHYYAVDIEYVSDNIKNLYSQNLFKMGKSENKNRIFFDFIIKHLQCVRDILDLMRTFYETINKIQELYKFVDNNISTQVFNEEIFRDVLDEFEKLVETSSIFLKEYNEEEYLQNTFYTIMTQICDDINTYKSLLKAYKNILCLDPINSISSMITSIKNIENLKIKYSNNLYDLKLYLYYIQFYLDNNYKMNIVFRTYFENKKLTLIQSFNEQKSKVEFSDVYIRDEVFVFKKNQYIDKYMKKCFDENLDINYFIIFFDKKKYLDSSNLEYKDMLMKNYYFSNNQLFIENSEDLGLLSIFHTTGDSTKIILNEVENAYRVNHDNKNIIFSKSKMNNMSLLLYSISNYMFIAVKMKEKSSNDLNLINDLCKDFRIKFADLHVFKTIFK